MSLAGAIDYLTSPLAGFRPWRAPSGACPQLEFLRAAGTHPNRVFRAGNRTGKTLIAAVDLVLRAIGQHPFLPGGGPCPSISWVVTLDRDLGVGQIAWPAVKRWLPPTAIRPGGVDWHKKSSPEIPNAVYLRNGSEIHFRTAEAGRRKAQGVALHYAWVDEEHDEDLIEEVMIRLSDHGGHLGVSLTPVMRMAWVRRLEDLATTKVIRASTTDAALAGILERGRVAEILGALPDRQRRVRELGDFAALEGLVYPSFDRADHCVNVAGAHLVDSRGVAVTPWPLPPEWPRYAAIDFGFVHPTAVPVLAVDPYRERWFVERCYYARGVRTSRWATELRACLPRLAAPIFAEHDADARAELVAARIETQAARKDVLLGIEAVERALHPLEDGRPRLQLVLDPKRAAHPVLGRYDAEKLAWELERYRYAGGKSKREGDYGKDQPLKEEDDLADALRYLVISLEKGRVPLEYPRMDATPEPAVSSPLRDATPSRPSGWGSRRNE